MRAERLGSNVTGRTDGDGAASVTLNLNWTVVLPRLASAAAYYTVLISLGFPGFFEKGPHNLDLRIWTREKARASS